jgi:hypothetical protein
MAATKKGLLVRTWEAMEKIKDKYGLRYSSEEHITLTQLAETCLE